MVSVDDLILQFDSALRTIFPPKQRQASRQPQDVFNEKPLSAAEKKEIAGLMRVNHSGEVCAQALYQGQALTAKLTDVKEEMQQAALEEVDHLAWCEQRLKELDAHPSRLNIFWYLGSLTIGAVAGLIGDKWSLGFVVETERQVGAHLASHITKLPDHDKRTQAILAQMQADELSHAESAQNAGGAELPGVIKQLMRLSSKVMTKTAYYI